MPKSTYELCKMMAQKGILYYSRLDIYREAKHITEEQYQELLPLAVPDPNV